MGKYKLFYFFYVSIIIILCACNDPVFYAIYQEIKPIEPRIKGVPTNFAIHGGSMYVASGHNLFSYNKSADEGPDRPYWKSEAAPGGNILQIASAGGNLYALCSTDQNNNGKTVIRRLENDNASWTKLGGVLDNYPKIHDIFAAGGVLFVSATAENTNLDYIYYTILYIVNDKTEVLQTADPENFNNTGELNGAVYNAAGGNYFLTAKNRGVYRIDDFDEGAKLLKFHNADGKEVNVNFSGIIALEDDNNTILLISRNNGDVYTVNDSIERFENLSMGRLATGALVVWRENDQPDCRRLLLAGRQDSLTYSSTYGYSYGYMELELDEGGIKSGSNFVEPGRNSFSTLVDYERYQSSIGKYPVNYLFQAPPDIDGNMTLFASTQKNGVWSCRDRDRNSNKYWNAEGENEPVYFGPAD